MLGENFFFFEFWAGFVYSNLFLLSFLFIFKFFLKSKRIVSFELFVFEFDLSLFFMVKLVFVFSIREFSGFFCECDDDLVIKMFRRMFNFDIVDD